MRFAIPPNGWTEAEAFQHELHRIQDILGTRVEGLRSPQEAADWLNKMRFREHKPITAKTVKFWCDTRNFPRVKRVLGEKWYTTTAHVMAWLWTYATYAPLKRRLRGAA